MTKINPTLNAIEKTSPGNMPPDAVKHEGTIAKMADINVKPADAGNFYKTEGSLALQDITAEVSFSRSISSVMSAILQQKEANLSKIKKEKFTLDDFLINMGNVCDTGYLLLKSSMSLIPATNTLGVSLGASSFGIIGGVQSVAEGFVSIKQGIQALKVGDKKLAARLILTGVLESTVGSIMLLDSISLLMVQAGLSSGIADFFAANPWFLAILFLLITLPVLVEVLNRTGKIWAGKDMGSQMQLKAMLKVLEDRDGKKAERMLGLLHKVFDLKEFSVLDQKIDNQEIKPDVIEKLSAKMEKLQAEIGVEAALPAFKLIMRVLKTYEKEQAQKADKETVLTADDKAEILKTLTETQNKIRLWNCIQHVRLLEQILYVAAFPVGLAALAANAELLDGGCNLFLALANAMPGVLDFKFPFARNIPKVVLNAQTDKVLADLQPVQI